MTGELAGQHRQGRGQRFVPALVRLYPQPWRERYGEELADLLRSGPLTPAAVLDAVRGALDAHANLPDMLGRGSGLRTRVSSAIVAAFAGWVLFCFAAAGAVKSTEDPAFAVAGHAHWLIGQTRLLAAAAFAVAVAAVAAGALPLAVVAARQAWRRRDRGATWLFATPVLGVAASLGYGSLVVWLSHGPVHGVRNIALAVSWLLVAAGAAVPSVRAAAALMQCTKFDPELLGVAQLAATVAAGAMSAGLLAGAGYALAVRIQAPALFASSNGLLATPLAMSWALQLAVAMLAVVVADTAAVRGLQARRST